MPFIIKWEAVRDKQGRIIVENDPADPGGATYMGIDQASHPHINVRTLDTETATAIYKQEWDSAAIESKPFKLGEVYFNACVNCGVGRANKLIRSSKDASGFIDNQETFYRSLASARPPLAKFLKGWLNRTSDLRSFLHI